MTVEGKPAVLKKEMTVNASPVVVWETVSTEVGLKKFFARNVEIDLREGGTATFALTDTFSYSSEITNVVPLKALTWEEKYGSEIQTVEWTLESAEGGKSTKITMVASGFGLTDDGVAWGWETVMRALKWVVEEQYDHGQHCFLGVRGGLTGMGFKVFEVLPDSPASRAGIECGDRIQKIEQDSLCGIRWFADILHRYKPGTPIEIHVVKPGKWHPECLQITPTACFLQMGTSDAV